MMNERHENKWGYSRDKQNKAQEQVRAGMGANALTCKLELLLVDKKRCTIASLQTGSGYWWGECWAFECQWLLKRCALNVEGGLRWRLKTWRLAGAVVVGKGRKRRITPSRVCMPFIWTFHHMIEEPGSRYSICIFLDFSSHTQTLSASCLQVRRRCARSCCLQVLLKINGVDCLQECMLCTSLTPS